MSHSFKSYSVICCYFQLAPVFKALTWGYKV